MSARLYATLLALYPAELRNDFGDDMTAIFLEDLDTARQFHGHRGTVRVWYRTLKELCAIALPAAVAEREVAVPLIMFLWQEIYLAAMLFLAHAKDPSSMPAAHESMSAVFLISGIVPAIVASVAIRVGDRSVPVPLNLTRK